jgi:spermidine synthase
MSPPPAAPRERLLLGVLSFLFLLSGASGLIYQVLWLRLLALTFGVTTHAATAVLASFMTGLALGSFAAGRLVDRARRPLLWFGVAELLVGLSALGTRPALDAVQRLYVDLHPSLADQPALHALGRFALSFAVLVVPTTLMGATLPIVIKSSLLKARGLGASVGLLYGVNTAGAIAGTLLCGFVLIGDLGIARSFQIAAANNLAIGALAVLVGSRLAVGGTGTATPAGADRAGLRGRRVVLVVFAISGFASLALELVWFRILTAMLDTKTYAFTVMLATVLAGIALGSLVAAPWLRRPRGWWPALAALELAIGLAAVGSLFLMAQTYRMVAWAATVVGTEPGTLLTVIACMAAMFPTCLLLGVAFPIGLKVWTGDDDDAGADAGRRVGVFYAVNLTGAIAGALVAGFVLLPALGSRASLAAVAGLVVASGFLLLPRVPAAARGALAGGGTAAFGAAVVLAPDPFATALRERHPGETVLWREEGVQTTVAVHAHGGEKVLYLDGKHQANDGPGMLAAHRWIGNAGMLLHPDPRRALVIGLGGGATPGALARFPDVQVDVVELSQSVVTAAREHFAHANFDVVRRPNVRVHVDDGRNFLLLARTKYDVITADIIQPYHAGAGFLYALEYYRLARGALADGGLMVQWACGRNEAEFKMIMRTFATAFPEATVFGHEGLHLMIGARAPLRIRRADFERKLRDPRWREVLGGLGFDSFAALRQRFVATPTRIKAFVGDGLVLTDDRPLVEFYKSIRDQGAPLTAELVLPLHQPDPLSALHFVD